MKIEFICSDPTVAELFPPVPASQAIPDWYAKIPFYTGGKKMDAKELGMQNAGKRNVTVKACVPVLDYLTTGYVIRAHADITITPDVVGDEHGWWYVGDHVNVSSHPHVQCPVHMGKGKNAYMKIETMWRVKLPLGYSCAFYQPYFLLEDRFQLFPAIVDCDGYNSHPLNFPGLVLSKETFTIRAGDPLAVVFPFKREDWTHSVATEKPADINPVNLFITRGYKKLFHRQKSFK